MDKDIKLTSKTDFSIESLLKKETQPKARPQNLPCWTQSEERLPFYPTTVPMQYESDSSSSTSPEPRAELMEKDPFMNNSSLSPQDLNAFSWLSCTRFKPPKIPRSRRRIVSKRYGRGPRIPFAPHQIAVLESTFSKSQYLSSDCIHSLAETLRLSETRVKIWFQNRRARYRREKEGSSFASRNGNELNTHAQIHSGVEPLERHGGQEDSNLLRRQCSPVEDLSKRTKNKTDFLSQQLEEYRKVQDYFLHQEQLRMNSATNYYLPQFKSSILQSVLQQSPPTMQIFPTFHVQNRSGNESPPTDSKLLNFNNLPHYSH